MQRSNSLLNLFLKIDWIIILVIFGFATISLFNLYTTLPPHYTSETALNNIVIKQALFISIGLIALFTIALKLNAHYLQYMPISLILWSINLALLILVLFTSTKIAGTHRWFNISGFTFQPSEFAKYTLIFWLASILYNDKLKFKKKFIVYWASTLLTAILIFLEPDAGTTIIIMFISSLLFVLWALQFDLTVMVLKFLIPILFILSLSIILKKLTLLILLIPILLILIIKSKIEVISIISGFLILVFLSVCGMWASWHFNILKDYQKKRLEPYIKSYQEYGIKGLFANENIETFHTRQSKIAIGSGKLTGKGPALGTQSRLSFLPEYRTDFFYAAFSEEFGLIGAVILITLYTLLFLKLVILSLRHKDYFIKLVIIGILGKLWIETFINIGMNLAILPTKGVALPFLSYGGSGTIANYTIIGVIESLICHSKD